MDLWPFAAISRMDVKRCLFARNHLLNNGICIRLSNDGIHTRLRETMTADCFRLWSSKDVKERRREFSNSCSDGNFAVDITNIENADVLDDLIHRRHNVPLPTRPRIAQDSPRGRLLGDYVTSTDPARDRPGGAQVPTREDPAKRYQQQLHRVARRSSNAEILADLAKLSNRIECSSDQFEPINTRLCIFQRTCQRVGINQPQAATTFPVILRDRAQSSYYPPLCLPRYVKQIKGHLETRQARQQCFLEL